MSITVTTRTEIIELVVGMFNAAPGASVLSELVTSLGRGTIKQLGANLEGAVFNGIYPTFLTSQEFADRLINNLVGTEVAAADKASAATLIVAQLAAGASRSSAIVDAINTLKAVASTNTAWINGATAFNNKVSVATYYTVDKQLSASTLAGLQSIIASVTSSAASVTTAKASVDSTGSAGLPFTLTTGVDNLPGTAGNDTFNGLLSAASTLTALDNLDGGAGDADTLSINDTAGNSALPAGLKVKNIETAVIASVGDIGDLDVSGWTGLTSLITAGTGVASAIVAAATTNVSTTDASQGALVLGINGGKDVTVTSSLVGVASTSAGGGITIGATTAPKGAVVVTQTATSANAAGGTTATGSAVTVTGGTTVNVTQTIAATAAAVTAVKTGNITVTNTIGAIGVTGTADTKSVSVTQSAAVASAASTTVGVIGVVSGGVTIADANAGSATKAATIASVTLNNYGVSTISSNALTTVNLSGTAGTLGITTGLTAPTNTTLALNVNGLSGTNTITDSTAATGVGFATINLAGNTKASTIANIAAVDATALNVSGDQVITLTSAAGMTTLSKVAVSGSAGLTADLSAASVTSIDASGTSGAVTVTVDSTKAAYTGGSGVDSVTIIAAPTKAISGGAGSADVIVNNVAATDVVSGQSNLSGFEVLRAGALANGLTVSASGFTGLQVGATAGAVVFNNVAAGTGLRVDGNTTTGTTYTLTNSAGLSDSVNITLVNQPSDALVAAGTLVTTGVETLNFTLTDAPTTARAAALVNTATLTDSTAKAITVTGNAGLTLTNTGLTKVASFDASGVTAGAVTYTSATTIANSATTTITGGAGADVLTGGATADTINGGVGNDTLTGGAGSDTIDGGLGVNTFSAGTAFLGAAVEGLNSGTATGMVINLSAAAITATTINTAMTGTIGTAALLTSVASGKTANIYATQDALFSQTQDTLTNIQNVIGSTGADYIAGSAAAGGVYTGGTGADYIRLNSTGVDTVVLAAGTSATVDSIVGFSAASDVISLSITAQAGSLVSNSSNGAVVAGAAAVVEHVGTAATTLGATTNVVVYDTVVAGSAALLTAIGTTAGTKLTTTTAFTANSDLFVAWTDGTNAYAGLVNDTQAGGVTAALVEAELTYTNLVTLTGVTSVAGLTAASFGFIA